MGKWLSDCSKKGLCHFPSLPSIFPLVEIHDSARRNGFCLLTLVKNGCDVIFYKVDFFFALSSSKKSPMILSFQGEISNVFSQIVTFEMSSKYTSNDEWTTHFTNCRKVFITWIFTKVPVLCNVHIWSSVPNFEVHFNISDCPSKVGITGFVEYTLQNIICNIFRAFHMVILA